MSKESPPESLEFHYVKSNGFRVVHADGVWGGPTPRGYITMSFFSERAPIPARISHELQTPEPNSPDRIIGPEIARDAKDGLVREVEVEVMVDLAMAKSLLGWLGEKVLLLEGRDKAKGKAG
jgi:hypothetical protein